MCAPGRPAARSGVTDTQGQVPWPTRSLSQENRTWGSKWEHGNASPLLLMGVSLCFLLTLGSHLFF